MPKLSDIALFSTRYGAALSWLRNKLVEDPKLGVIFTPITYPDVVTAILSSPCSSYMVDIEDYCEVPSEANVRALLEEAEEERLVLVVSQVEMQVLPKGLQALVAEGKLIPLYVSNDFIPEEGQGIYSLDPLLPSAAAYLGPGPDVEKLQQATTTPVGGDYTGLTYTQYKVLETLGVIERAREELLDRVDHITAFVSPLSQQSATVTVHTEQAIMKATAMLAAGYSVGSPVTPLHKVLKVVSEEDYPNAEKWIQEHISFSIMDEKSDEIAREL
jgi:hypothetical protein